jgi:hypothetical protein
VIDALVQRASHRVEACLIWRAAASNDPRRAVCFGCFVVISIVINKILNWYAVCLLGSRKEGTK